MILNSKISYICCFKNFKLKVNNMLWIKKLDRLSISVYLLFTVGSFAQKGMPYRIYSDKGKSISFEKMTRKLGQADVVLFGEFHDNSLGHWLQLEVLKSLHISNRLVLGAEMFEADNQDGLNAYLIDDISDEEFSKEVRLWPNYKTDYKPLVDFAKGHQLRFIATNVPRRYASQVYKKGVLSLDSLSVEEKSWIAPLPFPYDANLPGYKKMMSMFEGEHSNENLPMAQAIKDATMGYFITENFEKGSLFLHFNGTYHSNFKEGIVWYLNRYSTDLSVVTIAMVVQDDVFEWDIENKGMADFIIVIDRNITKTF